jgi:hypothetical protein
MQNPRVQTLHSAPETECKCESDERTVFVCGSAKSRLPTPRRRPCPLTQVNRDNSQKLQSKWDLRSMASLTWSVIAGRIGYVSICWNWFMSDQQVLLSTQSYISSLGHIRDSLNIYERSTWAALRGVQDIGLSMISLKELHHLFFRILLICSLFLPPIFGLERIWSGRRA